MQLSAYTRSLLDDIERRISPETEEEFRGQWEQFWAGEHSDTVFSPKRKVLSAPSLEVKEILINDALTDYELMLDSELARVSRALQEGDGTLSIRANYGTGIIPTLFGAKIFTMPREQNTLPTSIPFGDEDEIRRIIDGGVPSLDSGFGKKALEYGEMCHEIFKNYPNIAKYIYMYHPDTQGPMDIAELLWGAEIFYAFYDDPDMIHDLLRVVVDTYKGYLDKWFRLYPNRDGLNVHWDFFTKGNICIRNDSSMNLSPDIYREFVFPYDNELLNYFDGGIVHFCGRGDHYIDIVTEADKLYGINLSQPHLNNMDKIYANTVGKGKKIMALNGEACLEYAKRPDAVPSMVCSVIGSSVQAYEVKK